MTGIIRPARARLRLHLTLYGLRERAGPMAKPWEGEGATWARLLLVWFDDPLTPTYCPLSGGEGD